MTSKSQSQVCSSCGLQKRPSQGTLHGLQGVSHPAACGSTWDRSSVCGPPQTADASRDFRSGIFVRVPVAEKIGLPLKDVQNQGMPSGSVLNAKPDAKGGLRVLASFLQTLPSGGGCEAYASCFCDVPEPLRKMVLIHHKLAEWVE